MHFTSTLQSLTALGLLASSIEARAAHPRYDANKGVLRRSLGNLAKRQTTNQDIIDVVCAGDTGTALDDCTDDVNNAITSAETQYCAARQNDLQICLSTQGDCSDQQFQADNCDSYVLDQFNFCTTIGNTAIDDLITCVDTNLGITGTSTTSVTTFVATPTTTTAASTTTGATTTNTGTTVTGTSGSGTGTAVTGTATTGTASTGTGTATTVSPGSSTTGGATGSGSTSAATGSVQSTPSSPSGSTGSVASTASGSATASATNSGSTGSVATGSTGTAVTNTAGTTSATTSAPATGTTSPSISIITDNFPSTFSPVLPPTNSISIPSGITRPNLPTGTPIFSAPAICTDDATFETFENSPDAGGFCVDFLFTPSVTIASFATQFATADVASACDCLVFPRSGVLSSPTATATASSTGTASTSNSNSVTSGTSAASTASGTGGPRSGEQTTTGTGTTTGVVTPTIFTQSRPMVSPTATPVFPPPPVCYDDNVYEALATATAAADDFCSTFLYTASATVASFVTDFPTQSLASACDCFLLPRSGSLAQPTATVPTLTGPTTTNSMTITGGTTLSTVTGSAVSGSSSSETGTGGPRSGEQTTNGGSVPVTFVSTVGGSGGPVTATLNTETIEVTTTLSNGVVTTEPATSVCVRKKRVRAVPVARKA